MVLYPWRLVAYIPSGTGKAPNSGSAFFKPENMYVKNMSIFLNRKKSGRIFEFYIERYYIAIFIYVLYFLGSFAAILD